MSTLIKNHWDFILPITGFASDYLVWSIWSLLFAWHDRIGKFSLAYWVGDLILLPLFTSVFCYIIWNRRKDVSPRVFLLFLPLFVLFGMLLISHQPDAAQFGAAILNFRPIEFADSHTVSQSLIVLHLVYVFVKTPFIVFALGVYPFFVRTWSRALRYLMISCYALIALFVGLVILDQDTIHLYLSPEFIALSLTVGVAIVFALDGWFGIVQKPREALSRLTIPLFP